MRSMDFDPTDSRPAYQRIADDLRAAIASDSLRPGDKVPSERDLARRYGTAHMTARQALGLLKDEGLIATRQGRGTFVRPRPPLRIGSQRYSRQHRLRGVSPFMADTQSLGPATFEMLRFGPVPVSADIAGRLGMREGETALLTHLRFHAGTQIMQVSAAYVPFGPVQGTPVADPARRPWETDTITNLENLGIVVDEVIEEIVSRAATATEIHDLRLPPGAHVFALARTMLAAGKPVETCDITLPTDRFLLSYRFPVD
jgi:GntR family transcriptional regulator